jgi:hypothetical protein
VNGLVAASDREDESRRRIAKTNREDEQHHSVFRGRRERAKAETGVQRTGLRYGTGLRAGIPGRGLTQNAWRTGGEGDE